MYPDLSYLFHAIFGSNPDNWLAIFKTFGFFLAIAFLASAYVFAIELHRKAKQGIFQATQVEVTEGGPASMTEIAMNALAGLILGGKGMYGFMHFSEFRADPASVILSSKMNWMFAILGAALFGGLTWYDAWRKRKEEPVTTTKNIWPHDRISEVTVWAAVGGILGAKIFDLFDNWESFLADPLGSLLSGGGLAFYGGLVLGFIAVVTYLYRNNIPFLPSADAAAPAVTVGYGVGRIGCQLSGDGDWGIVNNAPKPDWMGFLPDWMWASHYPHNVLNTPHTDPVASVPIDGCTWEYCMQLAEPVYPTPIYEILMMSVIFGILWSLRKRITTPGMLFFIYLCLIAVERFVIEKIRVNVVHEWMGIQLTQAEIISIGLFLIGLAGIFYVRRRHAGSADQ
ncbi:MAG: prolipoprotein diacylglyceryl transferase [Saprospiraceae bacterium]